MLCYIRVCGSNLVVDDVHSGCVILDRDQSEAILIFFFIPLVDKQKSFKL